MVFLAVTATLRKKIGSSFVFGLSARTVGRISHLDLKFLPYIMLVVKKLFPVMFKILLFDVAHCSGLFQKMLLRSFYLLDCINKQYICYWSASHPRTHERPLRTNNVIPWCAGSSDYVIGRCFFKDNNYVCITISFDAALIC